MFNLLYLSPMLIGFRRFGRQALTSLRRVAGRWKNKHVLRIPAQTDDVLGGNVVARLNATLRPEEGYALILSLYKTQRDVFDSLVVGNERISSPALREYVLLLGASASGAEALIGLAAQTARIDCADKYKRRLKVEVANRALTSATVSELVLVLEQLKLSDELSEHQRVKVLSRLVGQVSTEVFSEWHSLFSRGLGRAASVKFRMYADEAFGKSDFRALEVAFCNLNTRLSSYYKDHVKAMFDGLADDRNYIDARYSEEKRRELRQIILNKLVDKQPYAYMRLGDGEAYGFSADESLFDEQGIERQERHWWGTVLDKPLRGSLVEEFQAGLAEADVLGVPTVLRLIRDFNLNEARGCEANSVISRTLAVMRGVEPLMSSPLIVEERSNLFVFDNAFLAELCGRAKKVVVLSGLTDAAMRACIKDEHAVFISIPTHQLLRGDQLASSDNAVLPFVYRNYLDLIRQHAGPGVLFLISAGFIGKIFVAEAKRGGSVVIDVGQLMYSVADQARS